MDAGLINFEGLITHEFPLDNINEAMQLFRSGEAGRIILDMGL
jgi:S-(hydroxymethyl)glutathione dehydrogenase/alcohol dehydrogenase